MTASSRAGSAAPALPPLHAVTDDSLLARADFPELARAVLDAGGQGVALHLRGRCTSGALLHELSVGLHEPARSAGALLLVNDRVDVALVAGLDGVHLGGLSLPAAVARRLLPEGCRVGVSVHDPEGAGAASGEADYLMVGTVFATPSHPGRTGSGPEGVARVRAAVGVPLLAIGGVTPERVPVLLAAGAHGVATVRGIWAAARPAAAVAQYLAVLSANR